MNMQKKIFSFLLLTVSFFLLQQTLLSADEKPLGQVEKKGNNYQIPFEFENLILWQKEKFILQNKLRGNTIHISLLETSAKQTDSENKTIVETDLGGNSKKKAPLAYKNPRVKNIKMGPTENPFKKNGIQLLKTTTETDAQGDQITTSTYADGSKSISRISKNRKEESSYNKKGILTWHHIEGKESELKYNITEWEDGSILREYSKPEAILSTVYDTEKKNLTFSFLNSNREMIKEISCTVESCE